MLADLRPAGLDLLIRPATTVAVTLEWPAGSLAGRTFTSTLNGVALDVTVNGDVMVVEVTAAQSGALDVGVAVQWLLLEEIDGTPEPVLVGTWTPDDGPQAISSTTVRVTAGSATVQVTVSSSQASIAALSAFHEPFVTVPSGWGERWAAAKAQADTRLVRVAVIGDSVAAGVFPDNHDNGWPGLLRTALQAEHGDGGSGWLDWFTSSVGLFGGPGGPGGGDATTTGAWTDVAGGVNGNSRRPTVAGNGATMTFHPRGTVLDLVSRTDPTFGRYDRTIDGGPAVQVPQNLAAAVSTVTVAGLAPGVHPTTFIAAAGQCRIHGVRGRNATGVLVDNMSQGGRTISSTGGANSPISTAAEGLAGQTTLSTSFDVLAPLDLLIVSLGVNDSVSTAVTTYDQMWDVLGNLQREIRAAGVDATTPPEVLVVVEHIGGFSDAAVPYKYGRIASILHEWARATGAAVVDIWAKGRHSGEHAESLGWFGLGFPDVHPSTVGHEAYFEPIRDLLV